MRKPIPDDYMIYHNVIDISYKIKGDDVKIATLNYDKRGSDSLFEAMDILNSLSAGVHLSSILIYDNIGVLNKEFIKNRFVFKGSNLKSSTSEGLICH